MSSTNSNRALTTYYANAGANAEPRLLVSKAAATAAAVISSPATMAGLDTRRLGEVGVETASIPQCRLVCARAILMPSPVEAEHTWNGMEWNRIE